MLAYVNGFCPACGERRLHIEVGAGIVHCLNKDCPRKGAAHEILMENFRDHLLVVDVEGAWTLKHPLIERLDNKMLECRAASEVAETLKAFDATPTNGAGAGVYRVVMDNDRGLIFRGVP